MTDERARPEEAGADGMNSVPGSPRPELPPESVARTKRGRVRLVLLGVGIVALIAIAIWFVHYQTTGKYMQSTSDAYIQADAVTVSPKVSGYVDRVFVADNQQVRAGQPLLQIDARDYRAQAAQFQAQIDVSEANARGVRAQIAEQQAAVDRARAELAAAQTNAAFADGEVARYAPLAASGAETGEKLASLQNQARQAHAEVRSDAAALTSAERRIGSLNAQVNQARSQGEASRAQLAAANVNLGSTIIRASIDGRVGDKTVRVGQFVQAGTRTMSVVPVSQLYVSANFKETQLGLMRPGQPVRLDVDALPGVEIRGHVESFSPGTGAQFSLLPPTNATGNFTKIVQRVPVRIAIDAGPDARAALLPGMSVEATVDTRSAKGALERIRQDQENRNDKVAGR